MKLIKKVNVTPVQSYTGQIIDSFNTEDDKQTNAPSLNAVENKLKWNELGSLFAESSNTTITVENLTNYNEILLCLTINLNNAYRVLDSSIIPIEVLTYSTYDDANGVQQATHYDGDNNRRCGLNYLGNNQLKLITKASSGVIVYAR